MGGKELGQSKRIESGVRGTIVCCAFLYLSDGITTVALEHSDVL